MTVNTTRPPDTLASRLREAMGTRSIKLVAREAKVDRHTLRAVLDGTNKRGMYLDTVASIAAVCGVDPGWLAYGYWRAGEGVHDGT